MQSKNKHFPSTCPSNAHILNAGMTSFISGISVPIQLLPTCASSPTWGLCSSNRFLLLESVIASACETSFVLWWGPNYMRWNNQLPQYPSHGSQQFAPFHCKQLPTLLFCESLVQVLPAFPTRQATTSSPDQIKCATATQWHSTLSCSKSHTMFQLVLWKSLALLCWSMEALC